MIKGVLKGRWLFALLASMLIVYPVFAEEEQARPGTQGAEVFNLGEVVVTERGEVVNLATTVTEVSHEDMVLRGAQTVAEALEQLPGVDVLTGGKGESKVRIRGFEQSQVRVLIDGVPAHETYYGTVDLGMLPVDSIAKITVTKGATSVLYGPNTMGGVVNIITKTGGPEPYTSFSSSIGNKNTKNFSANTGGMVGKFNYWFTYGYRSSDGWRMSSDFDSDDKHYGLGTSVNENGGRRNMSDYIKRVFHAKIGYEKDPDDQMFVSFDYHNNERGVPTDNDRYWNFNRWDQWHVNLVREVKLTDILKVKAQGFYVKHDDKLQDASKPPDHVTKKKWFEKSKYDDYSIGGRFDTYLDFGKWSYVKAGVNYIRDNHKQQDYLDEESMDVQDGFADVGWTPEEEYEADTWSAGIEDEIHVTDELSAVAGVSYDYWNPREAHDQSPPDSVDTWNPQIGLVYDLCAKGATIFHASAAKKTRFPSLFELYSRYGGGNPDLKYEKTYNYEVGVEHHVNEKLWGGLTYFYSDVEDLIDREKIDGEWVFKNISDATLYGVEAFVEVTPMRNMELGLNYTYQYAEDEDLDRQIDYTPRHRANADLRYWFPFGLTASVQGTYSQRQYEHDFNRKTQTETRRKLPDAFVMNCKFIQALPIVYGLGSEVWFQMRNVFDKKYDRDAHPMPGRNYLVGATFRY